MRRKKSGGLPPLFSTLWWRILRLKFLYCWVPRLETTRLKRHWTLKTKAGDVIGHLSDITHPLVFPTAKNATMFDVEPIGSLYVHNPIAPIGWVTARWRAIRIKKTLLSEGLVFNYQHIGEIQTYRGELGKVYISGNRFWINCGR